MFVRTVPVVSRLKLDGTPIYRAIQALHESTERHLDDNGASLAQIVEFVDRDRRLPLIEYLYSYESYPLEVDEFLESIGFSHFDNEEESGFALSLSVLPGEEASISLNHNVDRIEKAVASKLLSDYEDLLSVLVSNGSSGLFEALNAFMNNSERLSSSIMAPPRACADQVLSRLRDCSSVLPHTTAIICGDASQSYLELSSIANMLSERLAMAGVKKGDRVPLFASGAITVPAMMWGIMEVGAVCVPMDPSLPCESLVERLHGIDSHCCVVDLGANQQKLQVERKLELEWFALDEIIRKRATADPVDQTMPLPDGQSAAYALSTSGSTGSQKYAVNTHRALMNRINWMSDKFLNGASVRVLSLTSFNYDSFLWEVFWPLSEGGVVVFPNSEERFNLRKLMELCRLHKITAVDFFTSFFEMFCEYAVSDLEWSRTVLADLKLICFGGEPIRGESIGLFAKEFPQVEVINVYGCTETAIGSVFQSYSPSLVEEQIVGLPIQNTGALLLDSWGLPVPRGVVGELFLLGDCVGQGYLDDSATENENFGKFTSGVFAGTRYYRTGDYARRLDDGSLQYIGRIDQMRKVSGFRVDLTEVESELLRHASVVASRVTSDGTKLTAYVRVTQSTPVHGQIQRELREMLTERLPRYMVPAKFQIEQSGGQSSNKKLIIQSTN